MKMNNATKIGLMVIAAAAILIGMTIHAGNFNFHRDGYRIKVIFNDIDGVKKDSPVMFNGYEVGVVEKVTILETREFKMELTLFLESKARLRAGTKAMIKNLGFMGEKYVALIGGNSNAAVLPPDTVIQGQAPTDFAAVMANGNQLVGQLNSIASNINERLDVNKTNIDGIMSNANITLGNLAKISDDVKTTLSSNDKNIDELFTNLRSMSEHLNASSANLEEMSQDLKLNPWKLLRKAKPQEVVK
jgi:phospholipid/cholesterol/gamma-HCH transport system substrate-binding protein